jgi:hypothetical protein
MRFQKTQDGNFSALFSHKIGEFFVEFEFLIGRTEGPFLKIWNENSYLAYRFGLKKRMVEKFALPGQSFIPLSLLFKVLKEKKEKDNTQALANSKTTTNEDKQDGECV